jgi:tellurite resistance protein TerC
MGLVSLFFALKSIIGLFRYLKQGVSFILLFIAVKMLFSWYEPIEQLFKRNSWISLAVIIGTLLLAILLSMVIKEKEDIDNEKSELIKLKHENEELKHKIDHLSENKTNQE